jgi:small subunit ribosomal protein S6
MEHYETMFILKPDLGKDDLDKVLNQIRGIIGKNKGSHEELKEWGRQKLAYPIKKHKEGIYYLVNFHIDPDVISKLKQSFGLNESILRVLITNV